MRLIAFGVLAVAVCVLPSGCGPVQAAARLPWLLLSHHSRSISVDLPHHGTFVMTASNIMMFDAVEISTAAGIPVFRRTILELSSGTRRDIGPEDISIAETKGAVSFSVAAERPFEVVVSDDELRWLRWFGPRHVDGELVTESRQWLWMLLDWVLAVALAGWLATRRRPPS